MPACRTWSVQTGYAAAKQNTLYVCLCADHDQHGWHRRLHNLIGPRRHEIGSSISFSHGSDHGKVVVCLPCALGNLGHGVAGFYDQLASELMFPQQQLPAPEGFEQLIFIFRPLADAKQRQFSATMRCDRAGQPNGVLGLG